MLHLFARIRRVRWAILALAATLVLTGSGIAAALVSGLISKTLNSVVSTATGLLPGGGGTTPTSPSTSPSPTEPSEPSDPSAPAIPELPEVPEIPSVPGLPLPAAPELPDTPLPDVPPTGDPDLDDLLQTAHKEASALLKGETGWALEKYKQIGEDPSGELNNAQATLDGKVAELQGKGLAAALSLAAKIGAPTCKSLGELTTATGGALSLDMGVLGPLAPQLEQIDRQTNALLIEQYKAALTKLAEGLPPEVTDAAPEAGIVAVLLSLLQSDWTTSHHPPGDGDPFVNEYAAYLNLPILLDVDGRTGFDLCAVTSLDLGTLELRQTITKLPTAPKVLPVDVVGTALMGLIRPGYETKGSSAPVIFDGVTTLTGAEMDATIKGAGPTFNQVLGLTDAIQFRWEHTKPAERSTLVSTTAGGAGGAGTQLTYSASAKEDKFRYLTRIVAGTTNINLATAVSPAPTAWSYCTSSKGFCSNAPADKAAVQTASMNFQANEVAKLDQSSGLLPAAAGSECPAIGLADAHFTADRFFYGGQFTSSNGHVWIDTGGRHVTGCTAVSPLLSNLPTGFKADQRLATWGTSALPSVLTGAATSKSGTATCPTASPASSPDNTRATFSVLFNLVPFICDVPPVNTVRPAISAASVPEVGMTQTATNGTWTPTAPHIAFTRQWQRCDEAGCSNIPGATALTYVATSDDVGKTLRIMVTATNFDGTASATSLNTQPITATPEPEQEGEPESEPESGAASDSGSTDSGSTDSGSADTGSTDTGSTDSGSEGASGTETQAASASEPAASSGQGPKPGNGAKKPKS